MTDLSGLVPVLLSAEGFGVCAWTALRVKGWRGRGALSCFIPVFGCFAMIFAAGAPDLEARRLAGERRSEDEERRFRRWIWTASLIVLAIAAGAVLAAAQGWNGMARLALSCAIIGGTGSAGLLALLAKGWKGRGAAIAACFLPGLSLFGVPYACAAPDLVLRRLLGDRNGEEEKKRRR